MFDFQKQVIERSNTIPVLVDFWAPWCGPCRMLGPTLEQLAGEQKDKWELVKVNTEEQQELSIEYGIRSIPNCKLFHNGEVIGEFSGALPKFQLEQWLKANLPNPSQGALNEILQAANSIPPEVLAARLSEFVAAHPDSKEARLVLARLFVFVQPEKVEGLVKDIYPGDAEFDLAYDIKVLSRLMLFHNENGSPAASHLADAKRSLALGDEDEAIQEIIAATMADKSFLNDLPRKAAIALFHIWGNNHELTKKYRRRFDMALY